VLAGENGQCSLSGEIGFEFRKSIRVLVIGDAVRFLRGLHLAQESNSSRFVRAL
jgi:hypothetical protein